ncbi:hypothetical protein [Pseudonocardia aurantiaca]|uniref:Uncharacterized protein n=1 Tax=Pseudonocardia aurantiaca TaxID=75290 RepID=A0ABW4FG70_9PSEU
MARMWLGARPAAPPEQDAGAAGPPPAQGRQREESEQRDQETERGPFWRQLFLRRP